MFAKKFYKIEKFRKIFKYFAIIGFLLLCLSGCFLFQENGFNQAFIIGTSGLFFLLVSIFGYLYEKKHGRLSSHKFIRVFNSCAALLFSSWSILCFYKKEIFSGMFILAVSFLIFTINTMKKYEDKS